MGHETEELKLRVQAKRKELEARLERLKADAVSEQDEAVKTTRRKIDELDETIRDGWENLKEGTAARLNEWLDSA